MYQRAFDITGYLGKRTYDSNGDIVAAEAAYMKWLTEGNDTVSFLGYLSLILKLLHLMFSLVVKLQKGTFVGQKSLQQYF